MSARDPFTKSTLFEQALKAILRPLTRALIAQGVSAPSLYKIVKQSYVDAAVEELGPGATDSRVSVMTGIHRRDVKALRDEELPDTAPLRRRVSTLATVVGRWMSDADYLDTGGTPIPLPRLADEGPSFDGLVQRVSLDIRPKTVLDELQRQGMVDLKDGFVHLLQDAVFGPDDLDQKLHFFAHNLGDHMEAAVGNLLSDATPSFERAAFFNALKAQSVDAIEAEAGRIGMDALRAIGSQALEHQDQDGRAPDASHRFRFGIYFYREDEGPRSAVGSDRRDKTNPDHLESDER